MYTKLFIVIVFLSVSDSKYLTYKLDYLSGENFTDNRYTIELWPDYEPISQWMVDNDDCRYDVKIKFIPFLKERMIDYNAQKQGKIPSLNLKYFSNKDLSSVFDKILKTSNSCSYDFVWYESPSRFYSYHGFKMSVLDSFHNYSWTSYAPVPFLRNIDAVYRDPGTHRNIFISNNWYYAFDPYLGFVKQGRLSYLWSKFRSNPYVDSVLVTRNRTLCRFYDDKVHCTRYDVYAERLIEDASDVPRLFKDVFVGGTPVFPLKGSFWVPEKNETAILDSNDTFWIYDVEEKISYTIPFCEYMSFGKFSCCRHKDTESVVYNYDDEVSWWTSTLGFFLFGRK